MDERELRVSGISELLGTFLDDILHGIDERYVSQPHLNYIKIFIDNSADALIAAHILLRTDLFRQHQHTISCTVVSSTDEVLEYLRSTPYNPYTNWYTVMFIGICGSKYTSNSFYEELDEMDILKDVIVFIVLDSTRPVNYNVFYNSQEHTRWRLFAAEESVSMAAGMDKSELSQIEEDALMGGASSPSMGVPLVILLVQFIPQYLLGSHRHLLWLCGVAIGHIWEVGYISKYKYDTLMQPVKDQLRITPKYTGSSARVSMTEKPQVILPFIDADFTNISDVLSQSLHLFSVGAELLDAGFNRNTKHIAKMRDYLKLRDTDFNTPINTVQWSVINDTCARLDNFCKTEYRTSLKTEMLYLHTDEAGRMSHLLFANLLLTLTANSNFPSSEKWIGGLPLIVKVVEDGRCRSDAGLVHTQIKKLVKVSHDNTSLILRRCSEQPKSWKDLLVYFFSQLEDTLCHPDILQLIAHLISQREAHKRKAINNKKVSSDTILPVLITATTPDKIIVYAYTPSEQYDILRECLHEYRTNRFPGLLEDGIHPSYMYVTDERFDLNDAINEIRRSFFSKKINHD